MATRMLQRRGTAAEWVAQNPILSAGEIGFETDTKVIKIGDGLTTWADLATLGMLKTGGAFTGAVTLIAPTDPNHAARLVDVTSRTDVLLPKAGGTMTGALSLIAPTASAHAARKTEVDAKVSKSGDTMTGALSLITPTINAHAARKMDVDLKVSKSGDTMTGALNLVAPTLPAHASRLTDLTSAIDEIGFRQSIIYVVDGVFTPGNYPWLRNALITVVGAGGGGAGCAVSNPSHGSGGGGGGFSKSWLTKAAIDAAVSGSTIAVTVGVKGLGGGGATNGTDGNPSSFGSLVTALGGKGGLQSTGAPSYIGGGAGGLAAVGNLLSFPGSEGGNSVVTAGGSLAIGGHGGGGPWGGNTPDALSVGASRGGSTGVSPGDGGSGAASVNGGNGVGGAGFRGVVIVEMFG